MRFKASGESNQAFRRNAILALLDETGFVKVSELSAELSTSAVTIRKDLENLELDGLLIRTHGGAKKTKETPCDHNQNDIENKYLEKQKIAAAAVELVQDGDFVFVNTGSTCFHVCKALMEKRKITVVTNSIPILNLLVTSPTITTFFLGGKVNNDVLVTGGEDVSEQLTKYVADKLFLGMDGVDAAMGATTYNHADDALMRQMMQQAKEKILVVDDSKIGRVTFARIAKLTDFDTIITNYTPKNADQIEKIRAMGVHVLCV